MASVLRSSVQRMKRDGYTVYRRRERRSRQSAVVEILCKSALGSYPETVRPPWNPAGAEGVSVQGPLPGDRPHNGSGARTDDDMLSNR